MLLISRAPRVPAYLSSVIFLSLSFSLISFFKTVENQVKSVCVCVCVCKSEAIMSLGTDRESVWKQCHWPMVLSSSLCSSSTLAVHPTIHPFIPGYYSTVGGRQATAGWLQRQCQRMSSTAVVLMCRPFSAHPSRFVGAGSALAAASASAAVSPPFPSLTACQS